MTHVSYFKAIRKTLCLGWSFVSSFHSSQHACLLVVGSYFLNLRKYLLLKLLFDQQVHRVQFCSCGWFQCVSQEALRSPNRCYKLCREFDFFSIARACFQPGGSGWRKWFWMALNSGLWADLWCGWRSMSSSSSPRHLGPSCSGPSSLSCEPLFFWCSPSRWPCSTGSRPWWTTLVEEESFQGVGACPANLRLNSIWETWRKVKGIWPLWPWGHSCIDREQSHRKWKFFFKKKTWDALFCSWICPDGWKGFQSCSDYLITLLVISKLSREKIVDKPPRISIRLLIVWYYLWNSTKASANRLRSKRMIIKICEM